MTGGPLDPPLDVEALDEIQLDVAATWAGPPPIKALDEIQAEVGEWTRRFRPTPDAPADPLADALAVVEEAGEVARAALKRHHGQRPGVDWSAELRLEAGDVVISLLSLAANEGWSLLDTVVARWAEVRTRVALDVDDAAAVLEDAAGLRISPTHRLDHAAVARLYVRAAARRSPARGGDPARWARIRDALDVLMRHADQLADEEAAP